MYNGHKKANPFKRETQKTCALKIIIYDYKTYECAKRKLEAEHKYDLSI